MSGDDHRQSKRVARALMVRYCAAESHERRWQVSQLRDLSNGGARFLFEGECEIGGHLELQLLLPTADQPVPLKARITWARTAPLGMVELGVTFDPTDHAVQQRLDDAVAFFLKRDTATP